MNFLERPFVDFLFKYFFNILSRDYLIFGQNLSPNFKVQKGIFEILLFRNFTESQSNTLFFIKFLLNIHRKFIYIRDQIFRTRVNQYIYLNQTQLGSPFTPYLHMLSYIC